MILLQLKLCTLQESVLHRILLYLNLVKILLLLIEKLEKNERIDKNLLRYMTVKVKKFDLQTNYFSKKDDNIETEKRKIR